MFIAKLMSVMKEHQLVLNQHQLHMLGEHFELLEKWKEIHNLTTIKGMDNIILYHYVDCLKGLSFLQPAQKIFDFGSGPGFPGLIAAVFWPHIQVTLIEASRKKCSFLQEASRKMGLKNIEIKQERVENLRNVEFAISRATFSVNTLRLVQLSIVKNGHLALWVGKENINSDVYDCLDFMKEKEHAYQWQGIELRKIILLKKA